MRMAMAMAVEMVREAPEAAIGHALAPHDGASVQAGRHPTKESRSAITALDKTRRHGADCPTPHHGQDDATRAFHVVASDGFYVGLWCVI